MLKHAQFKYTVTVQEVFLYNINLFTLWKYRRSVDQCSCLFNIGSCFRINNCMRNIYVITFSTY